MSMIPSSSTSTYNLDRLIAGLDQLVSETQPLISGQVLPRGALLGQITASKKLTLSVLAAGDGSQVPYGILADDADASLGDVLCGVYVKGEFDALAVTYGTGHTPVTAHDALRNAGIFLKTPVSA